jgi:hypothetical protein
MAQLGARLRGTQKVEGSNPSSSTTVKRSGVRIPGRFDLIQSPTQHTFKTKSGQNKCSLLCLNYICLKKETSMPRGKYYPEELREEARRLRRQGWSLNEIAAKLGPPKNTLTVWVRGIELTPEQQARLHEKEITQAGRGRAIAMKINREARLGRIEAARLKAQTFLNTLTSPHQTNHIAAAMLYLGEGAKGEGAFAFGNSDPRVIRYWMYLLRSSFDIDESKFRIQIMHRADQNEAELQQYWSEVTGVYQYIKSHVDARTAGIPTKRLNYKGVCKVSYHDVALRRYLDALAHQLMARAVDVA